MKTHPEKALAVSSSSSALDTWKTDRVIAITSHTVISVNCIPIEASAHVYPAHESRHTKLTRTDASCKG